MTDNAEDRRKYCNLCGRNIGIRTRGGMCDVCLAAYKKGCQDERENVFDFGIVPREEILHFACIMEQIVAKNDNEKGDSWKRMPHEQLQKMMLKEVEESKDENAKMKEWIDIANFCMMIYNNTLEGKETWEEVSKIIQTGFDQLEKQRKTGNV